MKEVTIKMQLDTIETIFNKQDGCRYFKLTYTTASGLSTVDKCINVSAIREEIYFVEKVDEDLIN